jgi:hypothetical protein
MVLDEQSAPTSSALEKKTGMNERRFWGENPGVETFLCKLVSMVARPEKIYEPAAYEQDLE